MDKPTRESIRPPDSVVRRVDAGETSLIGSLGDLLIDAVESGASVGFLTPVGRATADRYWRDTIASLDSGDGLRLWVAERAGKVLGSVQLALCQKENGRHRAEVQKLFVHTAARGEGLATILLRAVEAEARVQRRSLLVLDTLLGSHAENVYRHLGWSRAGEIPGYATTPEGELFPDRVLLQAAGCMKKNRVGSFVELRIPPAVVALLAALLMTLLARSATGLHWPAPVRFGGALLLFALGAAVAVAGVREFRRASTTVNPMTPAAASALVRSGIYRHTRNPMYLGMLLMLAGWVVWLASIAAGAVLPAFVLYMNRLQIVPEERALASRFGRDFEEYRRSVRRWI